MMLDKRCWIFAYCITYLNIVSFALGQIKTVRLVGGDVASGIIEVFHDGAWGRLCGDAIDTNMDAAVICRQLGFKNAIPLPVSRQLFDNNKPETPGYFVLEDVRCYGNESKIDECPNSGLGSRNTTFQSMKCQDYVAASIWCAPALPKVRLVGGRGAWEGNVEIQGLGGWGYMCNAFQQRDGPFDIERLTHAAKVVCGQLGFNPEEATPLYGNFFDVDGSEHFKCNRCFDKRITPLIMSELHCDGTESSLIGCKYMGNDLLCRHDEAFAVSCKKEPIKLRLADGDIESRGRLEVYGYDSWSPVCDHKFTDKAAAVVGFNPKKTKRKPIMLPSHRFFGTSSDHIRLTGVNCKGNETKFSECDGFVLGRPPVKLIGDFWVPCHDKDQIGIDCNPDVIKARLVDGPNERSGRVELYYAGKWGTVCGNYFDIINAKIICQMLGFKNKDDEKTNVIKYTKSEFGKGNLDLIMQFATGCDEKKLRLESCAGVFWGSEGWCHTGVSPVAGVTCATRTECIDKNILYSHGQAMPDPDNCHKCQCRKGRRVCKNKKIKTCKKLEPQ